MPLLIKIIILGTYTRTVFKEIILAATGNQPPLIQMRKDK